jgi:predicted HTH transcriptional regulator
MNDYLKGILDKISNSIDTDTFVEMEGSKVELKDLSTGPEWTSLRETICAFLNTDGGYIICGVRERDRKYSFTGFNRNNESNLIRLQTATFKNDYDQFPDLSDFIELGDYEQFRDGEIVIITVLPLRDDLKFVKYNDVYYERKLTGDHQISVNRVSAQKEYKAEIQNARELNPVGDARIADLNLDKINRFINLLNQSGRKEVLYANIDGALPFLRKRYFVKDDLVTTLGMLVCGEDPFHFLENRVEVDCYYDTQGGISKDGKVFQSDVLDLMDEAMRFVWGHIRTGKVIDHGGKTIPQYPEELIREMINNSLAHRDYTINNFVTITIEPNEYIQIKNPGAFKDKIKVTHSNTNVPVRRLIPGIPESKNPKLASVLKVFDKIESQGRGMASLVNYTLDNVIDLPYYELRDESAIVLTIPNGKLVDDETEDWLNSFNKYITDKLNNQITTEHKIVLAYFRKSELLNRRRLYTILLSEGNNHFSVLEEFKKAKLIYEHESSTENIPIFIIDRELMKDSFTEELIELLGDEFVNYEITAKNILNTIYRYTKYNEQAVKASHITPEIYRLLFGKLIDPRKYESLGRKVRNICQSLESKGILTKTIKNNYLLNFDYKQTNKLL